MHLRCWKKAVIVVLSLGYTLGFQSPVRYDLRTARTLPPAAPYPLYRESLAPTTTVLYDSWRQYVPLVVSVAVIGDILLGSPMANSVLALARPPSETDKGAGPSSSAATNSKERIDTQKMANEAIEKAQNALELRRFLDDTKSDWDKIQDKQREVELQQAQFDDQESK